VSDDASVVLTDVVDGVGVVTMHRPEVRNALNAAMRVAVPAALMAFDDRDDIVALVLTGSDPAFSAGIDLKELSFGDGGGGQGGGSARRDMVQGPFPRLTKPLIGAINGVAVTGGFEYALGCDFLIASERARFADTHGRVGVMPGWGLTVNLAEAVGVRRARQLSFTGDYLDSDTALAWGLVNEVVAHDQLLARALDLGRSISELVPGAAQNLKETYRQVLDLPTGEAWALEVERSDRWLETGYDRERLAASREAIQRRGSGQI